MAQYPRLAGLVRTVDPRSPEPGFAAKVVPYLVEVWLDDYARAGHRTEIVETNVADPTGSAKWTFSLHVIVWRGSCGSATAVFP